MTGINEDKLNSITLKNDTCIKSFFDNSTKLNESIFDLNSCYEGKSLEYLFIWPINEIKNIKFINTLFANYSDVLKGIKLLYIKEDQILKTKLSRTDLN